VFDWYEYIEERKCKVVVLEFIEYFFVIVGKLENS
jgi:hypothetical protein